MTIQNTKKKASKLSTPNRYGTLSKVVEEQKDLIPSQFDQYLWGSKATQWYAMDCRSSQLYQYLDLTIVPASWYRYDKH